MIDICPAVLAKDPQAYRQQMERVAHFARRVHIDIADGKFAPEQTVAISDVWWPGGMRADLHVMYQKPFDYLDELIALEPQLIIVHAEADGDFEQFSEKVRAHGIEAGVALLPKTDVELLKSGLDFVDHVLIFSGNLGHFGGEADLGLLEKAKALKAMKPTLEIGWDGGINDQNAANIAAGGVEVLNTGGFIQGAQNPAHAYATLEKVTGNKHA
jgi:ribulose-phosphate 3-epimerase